MRLARPRRLAFNRAMLQWQARDALVRTVNDRFFYGWLMLAVAALGYFASGPGQSHLFSVFITPISEDLQISRTSVSSAYAAATLVAAFGLPYVGRLVDRFGVRRVMLGVAALLGASAIGFGAVAGVLALTVGFGALRFLGQGSMMLTSANLVSQWFSRKRGFALSLMALGFSLSMAAHPPLAQWLIERVGWREAWLWLGIATWVLLLPPVLLLVQNKPEDVGLVPDGGAVAGPPGTADRGSLLDAAHVGLTLKQAARTSAFWIIALSLSSLAMLVTALFFHQVSIFETQGVSAQTAARVFPVSAVSMVVFMPVLGRLLDRFPTKPMFALALLTNSLALVAMSLVADLPTALLYAVIFGLANAAVHTHLAYVWPRFFGRKHLGSIQGAAQTIQVVGASVGPLPLGIAYDLTGSYFIALVLLAPLPVICAVLVLSMRPPPLHAGAGVEARAQSQ